MIGDKLFKLRPGLPSVGVPLLKSITIVLFQCFMAMLLGSAVAYFLRRLYIPSQTYLETPLHFNFDTCTSLDGPCSFPCADVSVLRVFEPGVAYQISGEFVLPESHVNRQQGMILIGLQFMSRSGKVVASFTRTLLLTYQSRIVRWLKLLVFLPLYLFGLLSQQQIKQLQFHNDVLPLLPEDFERLTSLRICVHNKKLEIDRSSLSIHAQLGWVSGFLHNWPITSTVLVFGWAFCVVGMISLAYWLKMAYVTYGSLHSETPAPPPRGHTGLYPQLDTAKLPTAVVRPTIGERSISNTSTTPEPLPRLRTATLTDEYVGRVKGYIEDEEKEQLEMERLEREKLYGQKAPNAIEPISPPRVGAWSLSRLWSRSNSAKDK